MARISTQGLNTISLEVIKKRGKKASRTVKKPNAAASGTKQQPLPPPDSRLLSKENPRDLASLHDCEINMSHTTPTTPWDRHSKKTGTSAVWIHTLCSPSHAGDAPLKRRSLIGSRAPGSQRLPQPLPFPEMGSESSAYVTGSEGCPRP